LKWLLIMGYLSDSYGMDKRKIMVLIMIQISQAFSLLDVFIAQKRLQSN
jgi:hypothetical protein